jgi:hypothetical protein
MSKFGRIVLFTATLGLIAMLVVTSASATSFGVRMGYYFDAEAVSFGTEVLTPLAGAQPWYFNPNVELALGDFRDTVAMNADFHYDFQPGSDLAVWAGAGPALLIVDRGPFEDDTEVDVGANLLFGMGANHGRVRPYGQFKAVLKGDTEAAVAFGIRF